MDTTDFILVTCFVFGFGLLSKRLAPSSLTPPLVFVLCGAMFGPWGLGWLHMDVEQGAIHILAELTLVLVLFGMRRASIGLRCVGSWVFRCGYSPSVCLSRSRWVCLWQRACCPS